MIDKDTVAKLSDQERIDAIAERMADIITLMGEDTSREGLLKTPLRAAKALAFLTSGYQSDAVDTIKSAVFEAEGSRVVTVKDIEFYSLCEHHVLPFFGTVSIAYLPGKHIVGLSKLARIVNIFARRLQVQERLTEQLCACVMQALDARGVIVKCTAEHLCMKMRGVEKQHAATVTVEYSGAFETDADLRREVLALL